MKEQEFKSPLTPLEEFRRHSNKLSQLSFLEEYGRSVDREYLKKVFADTFIALDNLMDEHGITMREIFLGNDITSDDNVPQE